MAKSSKTKKKTASKAAPKAKPKAEETLTISKTALWQIISGVLVVILAVLLIFSLMGSNTQAPIPTQPGQPAPAPSGPVQINLEGVRSIGDENAPVTIVEYSDFTCPFCKRFYDDTYGQIKQNFIDQGLVRFVYKDFPVVGGQRAAEAGWCAHEQEAFFEYKAKIFANPTQTSDANLVAWAGEIGLDVPQFQTCLTSGKYQANVAQERQEAINNGVRGTPGFLVNGQLVSGAQPYSVFEQAITQALN
jgi:protein-disulfide isomerase